MWRRSAPLALLFACACSSDGDPPKGSASGAGGSSAASVGSGGETAAGSGGATGGASMGGATSTGGGDPFNDQPGELVLARSELIQNGWYQYYQGSTQYRP